MNRAGYELSHYAWLHKHLLQFLLNLGVEEYLAKCGLGMISSHGDKVYGYREQFKKAGLPFNYGVAIYLLTYMHPWSDEVRETKNGWVAPCDWVVANKDRFLPFIPKD